MTIRYFLSNDKSSIDSTEYQGKSALHFAVIRERADIVKLLIEIGANIEIKDNKGKTALDYAIKQDNDEIIQLLKAAPNR
jgi:uncharacterized protein